MDTEVDLTTADRDVLIAIIAELQAVIERLERRIAELEGQAKPDGPPRMPGLKSSSGRPPAQQQPSKQRRHGFARPRMTPTHRVEHVVENCPDCGTHLTGGWVQRTREVIELPVVPVQVTEHVYIARTCPACRRRCTPPVELDSVVLGQQRLGVNPESSSGQALISRIATLREEGRLPIRSVQWYLDTVHQLRLSVGAIVSAIHQTAQQAQPAVAGMVDRIRASPVVHADETGWRQSGANGYVWTFSTPTERYFPCSSQGQALRRGRGKTVVDQALSDACSGVLVSDSYAAYHHYDGPKQRCWAHPCSSQGQALLRDIHDLLALCQPFRHDPSATQAKLCRRIARHIKSLRHLVISRKVSGGTRSEQGTESKMTQASIFGTWRAQGLNPLAACRQLLTFPQV